MKSKNFEKEAEAKRFQFRKAMFAGAESAFYTNIGTWRGKDER